jgi:hypothetical protein
VRRSCGQPRRSRRRWQSLLSTPDFVGAWRLMHVHSDPHPGRSFRLKVCSRQQCSGRCEGPQDCGNSGTRATGQQQSQSLRARFGRRLTVVACLAAIDPCTIQ